jgi:DNA-binding MarR family transcriptional regulator
LSTISVTFAPAMIEDTVTYALLQAVKASRASISPALVANGLHPGQDLLLSALWGEDGITQAELVARLGIRSPTVSKALSRLERAGYVRREIDEKRSRRVFLTRAGRALRNPVEQAWCAADERLRGEAGHHQLTELQAIIGRLTESDG